MSDLGWLDVHGHYSLPETAEQAEKTRRGFEEHQAFYLQEPFIWRYQDVISYLDQSKTGMQMLSFVPQNHELLKQANDFGASIVEKKPDRLGLLAGLPTDDAHACLEEIRRTTTEYGIPADGFALRTIYNGVWLGDDRLEPVWTELDARNAVVFIHPNALADTMHRQCVAVIEVAFDTARCVMDMLLAGVFLRYRQIKFVLAHGGGAMPALAGRIALLGTQDWAPNPLGLTEAGIMEQLGNLYVDTAASATTGLVPALRLMGLDHCIYGSDCGVPCSSPEVMERNRQSVLKVEHEETGKHGKIGMNGWSLFPAAAKRRAMISKVVNGHVNWQGNA